MAANGLQLAMSAERQSRLTLRVCYLTERGDVANVDFISGPLSDSDRCWEERERGGEAILRPDQ